MWQASRALSWWEERWEGRKAERMRLVLMSLLTNPAWKHPWPSSKSPCFSVTLDQSPRTPVGPAGPFWASFIASSFPSLDNKLYHHPWWAEPKRNLRWNQVPPPFATQLGQRHSSSQSSFLGWKMDEHSTHLASSFVIYCANTALGT